MFFVFWGFFAALLSMWDPSSVSRDQTRAPLSGCMQSQALEQCLYIMWQGVEQ